ncbi:DNRLRE domain-containing protein [uncultured Thiohalocapsa sp.]|uniref:DNRLRE domain-containing protein n=1 Tax=uncultured Thiohalocapsa sp. TaxID=768990 RepID=UPI0025CF0571|nr:DNRLRE domain-containing protein [uncultured Thiohalocapsa sp.]
MYRPTRHLPRAAGVLFSAFLAAAMLAAPAAANQTLRYHIAASSDDAEEAAGAVDLTSSDLEITEDDPGVPQLIGLRFAGLDLPQGLPILGAYIQFRTDEDDKNVNPFNVTIRGELTADAAAFTDALNDISSRLLTTAEADWSGIPDWELEHAADAAQRTPDLTAIVQEIVDQPDWQAGNAMGFVLTGSGTRTAESFDGSIDEVDVADLAPELVLVVPSLERYRVAASDDDAEEGDDGPGVLDIASSDLELVEDHEGEPDRRQTIGIRLTDVTIPEDAQILSAHLQFAVDEGDKNSDPFAVTIWGEAADDPASYADTPYNISSRAKTTASVDWAGIPEWTVTEEGLPGGEHQRTPDLAAIVQEIVDRDGWQEGNAMAFIIQGQGQRTAESFDGNSALAPELVVRFIGEQTTPSSYRVRLSWSPGDDPATTMNVIWDQVRGSGATVHYDLYDPAEGCLSELGSYAMSQAPQRITPYRGMNNHFAKLGGLLPDTAYRFVIADSDGAGECMWFRTAPNTPKAFTYITGGDTKSSGDALQAGRWSNQMVAKLRPLFVLFTGDFNSGDGTSDASWLQWLTDWSEGTKSGDGRMYPILAVHGNHEDGDFEVLYNLFDSGNTDPAQSADYSYGAWTFGGSLLHVINLNSQFYLNGMQAAHDQQLLWLASDLAAHANDTFKIAGYHKPIRPHTSTKAENDHELDWADLFDDYGLTVANESDTHNHKFTFPLVRSDADGNDMGFVRDDDNGVLYVGEGSWGATPRADDDDKSWTLDSASLNQFKWNHVIPAADGVPAELRIRTVVTARYENGELVNYVEGVGEVSDDAPYEKPSSITLHAAPFYGDEIKLPFEALSGEPPSAPTGLTGEATSYTDITIRWTNTEDPANVSNISVDRRVGADGTWETVAGGLDPETTSFSQSELVDGTDYEYRVRANNVFGSSDWSDAVLVSTPVDNRLRVVLSEGTDGYTGSQVIAIASASPAASFAAEELSFDQATSDYGGPGMSHGLIRFDGLLASLPADTVVTGAELRFYITSSTNGPVGLHQMLTPWDGTSSWNSFGGDGVQVDDSEAVAAPDESKPNLQGGTYTTFDVTPTVQAWAAGASEEGWLILNQSTDGWDIATELYTGTDALARRPRLTVFYSPRGDADGDGVVARDDVMAMRGHLRRPASECPACDLDGDGVVSIRDARLLILKLRN